MMPFMNPSELNFSLPSAPAGACKPAWSSLLHGSPTMHEFGAVSI